MKAIVIAGTRSGCGKTSVSLGLMAALARRGLRVQPFKAGPDFIDPGHHALAAGRTSHNLDAWMMGAAPVRDLFVRACRTPAPADAVVVEGVMGLYDGRSGASEAGSTAELAKLLDLPVLLVADASSLARSVVAAVAGYAVFDPALRLAGVLLNRTGGSGHAELLREAWAASPLPLPPLLGLLPKRPDLTAPSRHLGLAQAGELESGHYAALADWLEDGLDLDALLTAFAEIDGSGEGGGGPRGPSLPASGPFSGDPAAPSILAGTGAGSGPRLGVAWDEAFSFYYPENLRLLAEAGAELVRFSPLRDRALPAALGGLYLGGGYPELHAAALAANASMRRAVAALAAACRPVLAECGGFMYLLDCIEDAAGQSHPMAGVFRAGCHLESRFQGLGYREVRLLADGPLGPAGQTLRGHEFHYSRLTSRDPDAAPLFAVSDRRGPRPAPEGWRRGNALGSYVHLHFASAPEAARRFVAACARP